MPVAPIATDLHQTLDIQTDLFPQIAFYTTFVLDDSADFRGLFFGQVLDFGIPAYTCLVQYFLGPGTSDTEYVGQSYFYSLVWG